MALTLKQTLPLTRASVSDDCCGDLLPGMQIIRLEFEPFATTLEMENCGTVVASLGRDSGYVPYTAYCAKKSYMEKIHS